MICVIIFLFFIVRLIDIFNGKIGGNEFYHHNLFAREIIFVWANAIFILYFFSSLTEHCHTFWLHPSAILIALSSKIIPFSSFPVLLQLSLSIFEFNLISPQFHDFSIIFQLIVSSFLNLFSIQLANMQIFLLIHNFQRNHYSFIFFSRLNVIYIYLNFVAFDYFSFKYQSENLQVW